MFGALRVQQPSDFAQSEPFGIIGQHQMEQGGSAKRRATDEDHFFHTQRPDLDSMRSYPYRPELISKLLRHTFFARKEARLTTGLELVGQTTARSGVKAERNAPSIGGCCKPASARANRW